MDSAWVRQLLGQVNKRKMLFEVPGYRQSRKVEGMFDRDDELYGFKNLCVYVDAGLVGREKQIAEILSRIDSHICSYEHYCHIRWLMFFGSDQDKLKAPGPSRVHHAIRALNWEGTLRKFISPEAMTAPIIIPRLHNPGSVNTRCPDRKDLGLFFCRDNLVYVNSEEDQMLFRRIGSRCIWIFLGQEESPLMEAGTFVPQVIVGCNTQE